MSMSATPCLTIADMEKDYLLRCLKTAVKVSEILAKENKDLRQMLGMEPSKTSKLRFRYDKDINHLPTN